MAGSTTKRLYSLDCLRVLAVFMILYDHLGALRNEEWVVKRGIDFLFAIPLHIIQDFGALGVAVFFVISGFLFAWNGGYKTVPARISRRVCKLYLSSLISFLGFWLFQMICWNFFETYWHQFSIRQWLESMTLAGYFTGNGEVVNGTTWFLVPLFFFYAVASGYAFLAQKYRWKALWLIESFLGIFFYLLSVFENKLPTGLLVFIYLPFGGLILAEINKGSAGMIGNGIALIVVNYLAMVMGFHRFSLKYYTQSPYLVSYLYAVLLVVLVLSWEKYFGPNRCVSFLCRISFAVYLLQMTWGGMLMQIFSDCGIPFTAGFMLTVAAVFGIAWVHTRYVEERLLTRVLRGLKP